MIDTVSIIRGIDLLALIEQDTQPARKGRLFCPFCQNKHSGSLALQVYHDGYYHCFGCGAHGDAIDYVQRRDRVDFVEACKRLGWNGGQLDEQQNQQARVERAQAKLEDERKNEMRIQEILTTFSEREIAQAYHRIMTGDHVAWWESQGIPRDWQDYLSLGYTTDKAYYDRDGILCHSPAYTIPYYHADFELRNVQYRLQDPANPKDRYRFESGLKTTYYMVEPNQPLQELVIVCEGAKKGIVCKVHGGIENATILAVPAKVDFGGIADYVKDCAIVWIILDPDAWLRPQNATPDWKPSPMKLAERIGKAARIVRLPVKLDDGILQHGLRLGSYLSMATKPN